MKIVDFEPDDLVELLECGGEAFAAGRSLLIQPGYGQVLKEAGPAWSGFDVYGNLVGCGGVAVEHPGCSTAWTLFNPHLSGPRMFQLTRVAKRVLASCPTRRVQAHADPSFAPAGRWLALLGFQYEGRLRCYSPDGRDMDLFALVKP
jgi:hypothetical protein